MSYAAVENGISKYERARVIGLRAQMLQHGAPPLVTTPGDAIETATKELDAGLLAVSLLRQWRGGHEYYVPASASVAAAIPQSLAPIAAAPQAMSWRKKEDESGRGCRRSGG